jgi:hypothetical protein
MVYRFTPPLGGNRKSAALQKFMQNNPLVKRKDKHESAIISDRSKAVMLADDVEFFSISMNQGKLKTTFKGKACRF